MPQLRHRLCVTVSRVSQTAEVAFNYRASCRARSHDEFTAKIGLVAEEADESEGWLEFIETGRLIKSSSALTHLLNESRELVAIFSASVGTARYKQRNRPRKDSTIPNQ